MFLGSFLLPILQSFYTTPKNDTKKEQDFIQIADIAGSDLYAEMIDALVAGNKSIIKQSLFTNDTSILSGFDTKDPAFYKCNILLSASNGIVPEIFPRVISENAISEQFSLSFNGFSGFLYYDEELGEAEIQKRSERALEIIKRKFEIDLILLNVSDSNFFPFVGYYPNWDIYLHEITKNLPMDGYWKAFDLQRLISAEYIENNHLSSTILIASNPDLLERDLFDLVNQVNFNMDSLDLSYLENLEIENLFEQFTDVLVNYESLFGNFSQFFESNQTNLQEDFGNLTNIFTTLSLSNESHYTSLMIQYEGLEEGITNIGQNEYSFNLWDAMGYNGNNLRPSDKIFIALIGAFMTEIDINFLCTEIIDETPQYFDLYEYLLEQIGSLLFYAGVDFDIQTLQDYSFELFWNDLGGIKRNWVKPVNLNDPTDFINFIPLLGIAGLPGIPTGIFNPIQEFIITYKISNSEPNMRITKRLVDENASFGVYNIFSFNITAENVGNETTWGVPTSIPLNLEDVFTLIAFTFGDQLMNAIWDVARVEYPGQYNSLEDFFNFDKDPRIFYFDSLGTGFIDKYYPDFTNISNLYPYNENMDHVIDLVAIGYPQLIIALNTLGISPTDLKEIFTNNESIWNADNWYLEPGEIFSYEYSNFSIEGLDSFSPFYRYNFTIKDTFPELPSVLSGINLENTDPTMALENDTESWIIQSEEKYVNQHEIEIQFLFKNETVIDLANNDLDMVSIIINMSNITDNIDLEIFNFSLGIFQDISSYFSSSNNNSFTYSFIKNKGSLEWLFDPATRENHTLVFRIKAINNEVFNISINDLDVEFSYRDVNEYHVLGGRIIYTSASGYVQYVKTSNSFSLSTYNMASIIATSFITNYSNEIGEINTYTLTFKNIGSDNANFINISLLIPGIIDNPNNFTLDDNHLYYYLPILAPLEEKEISFSFYTPNSGAISSTIIKYNNSNYIQNLNGTELRSAPNNICFSAPVDYQYRTPYVNIVEFSYNTSNPNLEIGETFNLTLNMKNVGTSGLELAEINVSMSDHYGDLENLGINYINFSSIIYNETKSNFITLKKQEWKGYYYPPINFIESIESRILQIAYSESIILGVLNFSIIKSVDKTQIEIGDIITVQISVKNTGTICIKDINLNDIISFTQIEFTLTEGSLIKEIDCIIPNQILNYSYQIRAVSKALVILKPASIEYYYLHKSKEYSNLIEIKIIIPIARQMLFIMVPSILSLIVLGGYLSQLRKFKSKKYELQRNELYLFEISPRETILKIENTLRDTLNNWSKYEIKDKVSKFKPEDLTPIDNYDQGGEFE